VCLFPASASASISAFASLSASCAFASFGFASGASAFLSAFTFSFFAFAFFTLLQRPHGETFHGSDDLFQVFSIQFKVFPKIVILYLALEVALY